MNGIFVVNQGGCLQPNALASMKAAADRWGVVLHIMEENSSALHPACWKLLAFEETSFDRLLILDADTLINSTCPNPFDEFTEDKLTVVSDRQTHQPARDKAELDEWEIVSGKRVNPGRYFNSGMMVASREHHEPYLRAAYALCLIHPHLTWHDQTPVNVVMNDHSDVLSFADETWNFHNPAGRIPDWQNMKKNIYHFPGNPNRNHQIAETKWNH